jgi:Asp-tRNA(Asn)/Glu-tRNA(Gln) amidotransferase A subunit family amidase
MSGLLTLAERKSATMDPLALPMDELVMRIARRELSAEAVTRASIERIESREPSVHAWQHFSQSQAIAQARYLDNGPHTGLLHGVPIGVKDLMDTTDMPTSYGSPIYAENRPLMDAACVAAARAAGVVIMGKTVTTEFATFQPGKTRNPRGTAGDHTPGGSSSGSAAAVASGMVLAALGTQTAGSIVRPAAYCGVVGYKPTHGTLPLAGIKALAPSLDTVGIFTRTVSDAAFFIGALARLPLLPASDSAGTPRLRIGICHTMHWDRASAGARQALADAARFLERQGAVFHDMTLPASCHRLTEAQQIVMRYEAAAAFAPETATHSAGFSPAFAALIDSGRSTSGQDYFDAKASARVACKALEVVFEKVDVLLAPSAEGEAPAGLTSTGDPIFNRMWSLLGNPCIHVPVCLGEANLPVGVTVIGPQWGDAKTLDAAHRLERSIDQHHYR